MTQITREEAKNLIRKGKPLDENERDAVDTEVLKLVTAGAARSRDLAEVLGISAKFNAKGEEPIRIVNTALQRLKKDGRLVYDGKTGWSPTGAEAKPKEPKKVREPKVAKEPKAPKATKPTKAERPKVEPKKKASKKAPKVEATEPEVAPAPEADETAAVA